MFHTAVAQNEFVTGPDHRKWATLPPDFSSDPAFTTDHRQQYGTAGHYAHAYLNKVHPIPTLLFFVGQTFFVDFLTNFLQEAPRV